MFRFLLFTCFSSSLGPFVCTALYAGFLSIARCMENPGNSDDNQSSPKRKRSTEDSQGSSSDERSSKRSRTSEEDSPEDITAETSMQDDAENQDITEPETATTVSGQLNEGVLNFQVSAIASQQQDPDPNGQTILTNPTQELPSLLPNLMTTMVNDREQEPQSQQMGHSDAPQQQFHENILAVGQRLDTGIDCLARGALAGSIVTALPIVGAPVAGAIVGGVTALATYAIRHPGDIEVVAEVVVEQAAVAREHVRQDPNEMERARSESPREDIAGVLNTDRRPTVQKVEEDACPDSNEEKTLPPKNSLSDDEEGNRNHPAFNICSAFEKPKPEILWVEVGLNFSLDVLFYLIIGMIISEYKHSWKMHIRRWIGKDNVLSRILCGFWDSPLFKTSFAIRLFLSFVLLFLLLSVKASIS